jgi:hypothetical protein
MPAFPFCSSSNWLWLRQTLRHRNLKSWKRDAFFRAGQSNPPKNLRYWLTLLDPFNTKNIFGSKRPITTLFWICLAVLGKLSSFDWTVSFNYLDFYAVYLIKVTCTLGQRWR